MITAWRIILPILCFDVHSHRLRFRFRRDMGLEIGMISLAETVLNFHFRRKETFSQVSKRYGIPVQ